MSRRLIDLSVTLVDKEFWPPHHRPRITYRNHDETWDSFERAFPGIARDRIPDGKSWATEEVTLVTHAGTHMDAPWHFHPTMDHALVPGGRPAATIEQVPLDDQKTFDMLARGETEGTFQLNGAGMTRYLK